MTDIDDQRNQIDLLDANLTRAQEVADKFRQSFHDAGALRAENADLNSQIKDLEKNLATVQNELQDYQNNVVANPGSVPFNAQHQVSTMNSLVMYRRFVYEMTQDHSKLKAEIAANETLSARETAIKSNMKLKMIENAMTNLPVGKDQDLLMTDYFLLANEQVVLVSQVERQENDALERKRAADAESERKEKALEKAADRAAAKLEKEAEAKKPERKLPKLNLIEITGKPETFLCEWNVFMTTIHESKMNVTDKFNYLLGAVKGDAKDALVGLAFSEVDYEEAIRILPEQFGKPEVLIPHMRACLSTIPKVDHEHNVTALMATNNYVLKVIRNLKHLKVEEVAYGWLALSNVLAALPGSLTRDWEKKRLTNSLDSILKELKEHISVLQTDNARRQVNEKVVEPTQNKSKDSKQKDKNNSNPSSHWGSASQVFVNSNVAKSNTNHDGKKKLCRVCEKGSHSPFWCRTGTVDERIKSAEKQKVCYSCLITGHQAKDCPDGRPCGRCKESGHCAALCQMPAQQASKEKEKESEASGSSDT